MNNWIILTVFYAVFTSFHKSFEKKAIEHNSIYEVLAVFSTISFLLVIPITKGAFFVNYNYLLIIFIKSVIIVLAWILGLKALKNMQLSIYGMTKISTIIFSVLLSCILLNEKLTITTIIGIGVVVIGLVLVNATTSTIDIKDNKLKSIVLLLASCFLGSISAILDKKLLLHISSSQLQFWFLLFLMIFYWIILLIKNEKICFKKISKNYWIFISAICLVVGDRLLFKANENANSIVILITMLKQLSVVISVLLGKLMFNEKLIIKKLLYSLLIIFGIIIMFAFKF